MAIQIAKWTSAVVPLGMFCVGCSDDGESRQTGSETGAVTSASSTGPDGTSDSSSASSQSASDSTGTTSESGATSSPTDGNEDSKFDVGSQTDSATGGPETYPVRMIPGLMSITFYERTGGDAPDPFTFTVDGPELTARLDDPLTPDNLDIIGTGVEFYDVYYSDIDGNFELDGRYLTISGQFGAQAPNGGGLNLAEIGLNYDDQSVEFGNYVASYVILGDNAAQPDGRVESAIDGDLQTHTSMGNTVGANDRLRVTLGFLSSSGPAG